MQACPCGKMQLPDAACDVMVPPCGDTCDRLLSCGFHRCTERCHTGEFSLLNGTTLAHDAHTHPKAAHGAYEARSPAVCGCMMAKNRLCRVQGPAHRRVDPEWRRPALVERPPRQCSATNLCGVSAAAPPFVRVGECFSVHCFKFCCLQPPCPAVGGGVIHEIT